MDTVSTYSEARNEYMKQLSTWITPYMITHYRNMWNDAVAVGGARRSMLVFQEKCAEVPKWNQDTIDLNVNKLLDNCRCDYLEELMAAVFIAHTKVLIAIRVSSKNKKLQITLPKLDHFLHRIFSECARAFWKAPFLFLDDQKPIEMQKNLLQAEALCSDAIAAAVRSLLPIKNILNEYLSDDVLSSEPIIEKEEEEKVEEKSGGSPEIVAPPSTPEPIQETESSVKKPTVEETLTETKNIVSKEEPKVESPPQMELESPKKTKPKPPKPVAELVKLTEDGDAEVKETPPPVVAPVPTPAPTPVAAKVAPPPAPTSVEPEELVIDTEQAVRFSNYDQVFDDNTDHTAAFKFVPKDGTEPRIEIQEDSAQPLSSDPLVTNLEAPGVTELGVDEFLD